MAYHSFGGLLRGSTTVWRTLAEAIIALAVIKLAETGLSQV